ncbi:MAG TPA: hypothetical protein QF753_05135, partial [Victivallales bacterium]|nr:hypothetical protein [Victivallales bacterium]
SKRVVTSWISSLIEKGYITIETIGNQRRIYLEIPAETRWKKSSTIEGETPEGRRNIPGKVEENFHDIYNNKINNISIDKENIKERLSKEPPTPKTNPAPKNSKLETIFDERLIFLRNEFKRFKCTFSNLKAIVKQAKKYFASETDDEIITALIDYWKKYKPNTTWNSGAWFQQFLLQAYEAYQNKLESAKLEAEQMKSNEEQRIKSEEQQNLQYQKDLELQKAAIEKFYSLPAKPQMNIVSKFNNEHKSKVGISIKNKIITGENPVNVIWFKNYLVSNLLSTPVQRNK